MQEQIFRTVGAVAFGLLLITSLAYGQSGKLIIQVPVEFSAGQELMPTGKYTIRVNASQSTVLLQNDADNKAVFVISHSEQAPKLQERGKLLFRRYGARYFLSQVWPAGTIYGRELPQSRIEREIARSAGQPAVVSLLTSICK